MTQLHSSTAGRFARPSHGHRLRAWAEILPGEFGAQVALRVSKEGRYPGYKPGPALQAGVGPWGVDGRQS